MAAAAPPRAAASADLIPAAFTAFDSGDTRPLRRPWTDATLERLPERR